MYERRVYLENIFLIGIWFQFRKKKYKIRLNEVYGQTFFFVALSGMYTQRLYVSNIESSSTKYNKLICILLSLFRNYKRMLLNNVSCIEIEFFFLLPLYRQYIYNTHVIDNYFAFVYHVALLCEYFIYLPNFFFYFFCITKRFKVLSAKKKSD